MPDVAFFYEAKLVEDGLFPREKTPSKLRGQLKPRIAAQLDCEDEAGHPIVHLPEQIVFVTFAPLPDGGDKMVIMQIFCYDWPDRMRNVDKRMKKIGETARRLLALPPGTVDVSFVKIHRGSENEAPGWVNV